MVNSTKAKISKIHRTSFHFLIQATEKINNYAEIGQKRNSLLNKPPDHEELWLILGMTSIIQKVVNYDVWRTKDTFEENSI